jgi:hypothetical protein
MRKGEDSMKYAAVLLGFSLGMASYDAAASCECKCVDGEQTPVCTSSMDLPPICPPRVCAIVPPAIPPIPPPQVPPVGTEKCSPKQVYNEKTGQYEWKEICE